MTVAPEPILRLLEAEPLPAAEGDKDDRGTLVLVAGSATCPGAAVLSAVAALRVGIGRVQIVTAPENATALGVAVPEALVLAWSSGRPTDDVRALLERADAVCIGPGLDDRGHDLAVAVTTWIPAGVPVLLDARALPAAHHYRECGHRFVLAPNVAEATELLSEPPAEQGVHPLAAALSASMRVPVAVRGETTVLAHGQGAWWSRGAVGLGTAGSGDVLAGLTAGMLGRGLDDAAALGWGIAVHAGAGRLLAGDRPHPGYLARDLLDVIPAAVASLSCSRLR